MKQWLLFFLCITSKMVADEIDVKKVAIHVKWKVWKNKELLFNKKITLDNFTLERIDSEFKGQVDAYKASYEDHDVTIDVAFSVSDTKETWFKLERKLLEEVEYFPGFYGNDKYKCEAYWSWNEKKDGGISITTDDGMSTGEFKSSWELLPTLSP